MRGQLLTAGGRPVDAVFNVSSEDLPLTLATQTTIGEILYPRTQAEIVAGVNPVYYYYPEGDVRRYGAVGDNTTDDTAAFNAALSLENPNVYVPMGGYRITSTLLLKSNVTLRGANTRGVTFTYDGSGAVFANATPTVRIFQVNLGDFNITGTADIGLDLSSVSTSKFENIVIDGATTSVRIVSPTSGFSVYNRFYDVTCQNATTGFLIEGLSSNANTFYGCRGNVCTDCVVIEDSNDNHFIASQFESSTDGVVIRTNLSSVCDRNYVTQCRFENNSGIAVTVADSGCRDNALNFNYYTATGGTQLSDSGTRTQVMDFTVNADAESMMHVVTPRESSDGVYKFERVTHPGNFIPNLKVIDSGTTGNPTTIEAESTRSGGYLFRGLVSGSEVFAVAGTGRIRTNQTEANTNAIPTNSTDRLPIYDETGALVGYVPIFAAW